MDKKGIRQKWNEATNVYRTKNYIVRQLIAIKKNGVFENYILSQDIFYLRTPERDIFIIVCFGEKIILTVSEWLQL